MRGRLVITLSAGALAGAALVAAPAASAEPTPSGRPDGGTQSVVQNPGASAVQQSGSAPTAGCWFSADKPFSVARDVRSQSRITSCFGHPTRCYMNSYLEKYNSSKHKWQLVAANRKGWGSCKPGRKVNAKYRCRPNSHHKSYYHTVTVALASKNGNNGNVVKVVSYALASHCH